MPVVVPHVVLHSIHETIPNFAPRPETAGILVRLYPRNRVGTYRYHSPTPAMVPTEDLTHIATEDFGELKNCLLGWLGARHLIVEPSQDGFDVLDTDISPVERQMKAISCEVYRVEGVCLGYFLNFGVRRKAVFHHDYPLAYCRRRRGLRLMP